MQNLTPVAITAFSLELVPAAIFGFASERARRAVDRCPLPLRIFAPAAFSVVYLAVAISQHILRWDWLVLYAGMPVLFAWLEMRANTADPEQRGNWRDAFMLLVLGLAVDLRWFDSAWPHGLEALGKILLVDIGLYIFVTIRHLSGTGFDFHFQGKDWIVGFRELAFFAPIVLALGLALGFLHPRSNFPTIGRAVFQWVWIFFFIAVPEELFFRAWAQNLLERRVGRRKALIAASILFGLSHFNKRLNPGSHFNWHYVMLATIAGIFYGRAWRERRRVPASGITHATVDWIWSWWF